MPKIPDTPVRRERLLRDALTQVLRRVGWVRTDADLSTAEVLLRAGQYLKNQSTGSVMDHIAPPYGYLDEDIPF
jgi:hypothetical protein